MVNAGQNNSHRDAREDVGVVSLAGLERLSVMRDFAERRSTREYDSTLQGYATVKQRRSTNKEDLGGAYVGVGISGLCRTLCSIRRIT